MLKPSGTASPVQQDMERDQILGTGLYPRISGRSALLLEDDYSLALSLATEMEELGITIVGPFPTIETALESLTETTPDYAVLDINIRGRASFDVAERLLRDDVRLIFYTGYDASLLPRHLSGCPCLAKPAGASEVIGALSSLPPARNPKSEVFALLPALRRRAVLLTGDVGSADAIVEMTLRRAIAEHHLRDASLSLQSWIGGILECTALEEGFRYWQ